jgi:4,5:9,10-diseco-3-hydroxy-5,9,17-trioxoandrosta-1(10),2-diene-4-oate hydrolase
MSSLAVLGVPEGSPVVEVDGVRLAVSRQGHGPPVVCLHATGHGGRDFEAFAAAMKVRFEIIIVDWPGQGRSGPDREPASAARYADLLGGLLRALNIRRPIIVGNSIGGAAAIIHASREEVAALVLCDPGGLFEPTATVRRITSAFIGFFKAGARGAWWYRPLFALYYGQVLPSPAAAAQRRRMVVAAYEIAPILVQSWTSFRGPDADIRDLALGLEPPIWFAWARNDKVAQFALSEPTIRAMKTASVTMFAGGHAPFLEQPQAFVDGFEGFLAANRL